MKKPTVAVLFGGQSAEHSVSLQSAGAVLKQLDPERVCPVMVGITREGRWLRYSGPVEKLADGSWQSGPGCVPAFICPSREGAGLWQQQGGGWACTRLDAAFPVLHGRLGEDGTVQGLLELAGIPIVGCGTLASALCMDKDAAHRLVAGLGVAVPASHLFEKGADPGAMMAAAAELGYPVFVKPVAAGSSYGITRVEGPRQLAAAVEKAFSQDGRLLVEQAITGVEVGCAVLGEGGALTIGELDEVELQGGFFDFTEKYNLVTSKLHVPARLTPQKTREVKETAAAIYRLLGCRGFARVDVFVQPDGRVVFNEVNTIPGFTAHSRYPTMMQAAGLGFAQLVNTLVERTVAGWAG